MGQRNNSNIEDYENDRLIGGVVGHDDNDDSNKRGRKMNKKLTTATKRNKCQESKENLKWQIQEKEKEAKEEDLQFVVFLAGVL